MVWSSESLDTTWSDLTQTWTRMADHTKPHDLRGSARLGLQGSDNGPSHIHILVLGRLSRCCREAKQGTHLPTYALPTHYYLLGFPVFQHTRHRRKRRNPSSLADLRSKAWPVGSCPHLGGRTLSSTKSLPWRSKVFLSLFLLLGDYFDCPIAFSFTVIMLQRSWTVFLLAFSHPLFFIFILKPPLSPRTWQSSILGIHR